MLWDQERTEMCVKLWNEGLSATEVANRIRGGVTRNAVIGKIHRLGMSNTRPSYRPTAKRQRGKARATKPSSKNKPYVIVGNPIFRALIATEVPEVAEINISVEQRKTMATLEDCHCKWPYGDPQDAGFYFCGGERVNGLPYCAQHARKAFNAVQPKNRELVKPTPARTYEAMVKRVEDFQRLGAEEFIRA